MKTFAAKALRASGLVAFFLLTTAGIPTNGIPTNGIPTNGIPTNGIPTNGIPTNGIPTNGASLDALESSLVFANKAVHEALIGRPFTKANLTDRTSPVYQIWFDPFSALLVSYLWQDAHALGDDLTFSEPSSGNTFRFFGNLGLCDRRGTGWARNTALDDSCARWLSAMIITQINQSGIHNLFSARGPTSRSLLPGFIGPQLTDMSPALHSFDYKFGTHDPVEALRYACPAGTTGPENCGWQPGLIGTGTPGALVKVSLSSGGVPMLAQVNQGIMGHDYPFTARGSCFGAPPGCTDADVLGAAVGATVDPSVQFTIPPSGVFNVQWTTWARDKLASGILPVMRAQVIGPTGTVRFASDEVDVFPSKNREMTASGNIFGQANIDPALWKCEARLVGSQGVAYGFTQIDAPKAFFTAAHGINNADEIVGGFFDGSAHGFLRTPGGSFRPIDVTGASFSVARGINDAGQIVGAFNDKTGGHGFLRNLDGRFTQIDFPHAFATEAHGINNAGQIVGFFRNDSGTFGFLRDVNGSFTPFFVKGAFEVEARGIDSAGTIVGFFRDSVGTHGAVWRPVEGIYGGFRKIDLPGAFGTSLHGLNDAGQIVGMFSDDRGTHGFLLRPDGSFIRLDPTGSVQTQGFGINVSGKIVGLFRDRLEGEHGFLATLSGVRLCDASNQESCTACTRPFEPGALHVIFPNAHLWLSRNWNNAQDYYRNRSCSSDLSTCIASFEGFIDAFSFNAAIGRFVPPCLVQSFDRDTFRPLPYPGAPRRLFDADSCFVGTAPRPFFSVTTFFPNYRDFGACGAIGPAPAASCAYTPRPRARKPKDDEDDD